MYYQVGAATIRQIPYPGSGTNFPDTEKPRNSDHVGSEFRGKDTANIWLLLGSWLVGYQLVLPNNSL